MECDHYNGAGLKRSWQSLNRLESRALLTFTPPMIMINLMNDLYASSYLMAMRRAVMMNHGILRLGRVSGVLR